MSVHATATRPLQLSRRRAAFRGETPWVGLLLLACGLGAYGNALRNPFVIDDPIVIAHNPRVQDLNVREIFTHEYWPGSAVGNQVYRPLTLLSLALNWALSPEPWTFRLVNLLLHVAAGLALYQLAQAVTHSKLAALAAALLFIVHPIHTAVLNQVVDRADLAAAACVLAAAWLYARDFGAAAARALARPVMAAGLFAIGLLFKENAITLVPLVLVLHLCRRAGDDPIPEDPNRDREGAAPDPRQDPGRDRKGARLQAVRNAGWLLLRCYLPLLLIAGGYLATRAAVLDNVARPAAEIAPLDNIIARPEYGQAPGDSRALARWGTPVAMFGRAVARMAWPQSLSWDYSYAATAPVRSWLDPELWLGAAVALAALAALVLLRRRAPAWVFAAGLLLATYSVVSNTFVLIGAAFAERYLYLPSAGFCLFAGLVVAAGVRRVWATAPAYRLVGGTVLMLFVAAVLASAARTIRRNGDFASKVRLNQADLHAQPRSARLWTAVAQDALLAGDYPRALAHAEQALAIYPDGPDAWQAAGLAHWKLGQADAALGDLIRGLQLGGVDDENACMALGDLLVQRGDYARAIALLGEFIERRPRSPTVLNNLAWFLITAEPPELRDPARALPLAQRAAALLPTAGDVLDTHVAVLEALGRTDEARRVLADGLKRIPGKDPYRPALERR